MTCPLPHTCSSSHLLLAVSDTACLRAEVGGTLLQCEPLVEEVSQARSLESASTQTLPAAAPGPERSDSLQAPHTPPELMHVEGAPPSTLARTCAARGVRPLIAGADVPTPRC